MKASESDTNKLTNSLGDLKISLRSKKLNSGKCQAKFLARTSDSRTFYGYALVEAHQSLRQVVAEIRERILRLQRHPDHRHMHLYALNRSVPTDDFIIHET